MDKPVVHIGLNPFKKLKDIGYGGMDYSERAGYVADNFDMMLNNIEDSLSNPGKFSDFRKKAIKDNIKYIGDESKKAVIREFKERCGC